MKLISLLLVQASANKCADVLIVAGKEWQSNGFYDGEYHLDGERNGKPKWTMNAGTGFGKSYYPNWNQITEISWNSKDTRTLDVGRRYQHAKGWVVKSLIFDSKFYGTSYVSGYMRFWSETEVDCPEEARFHESYDGVYTPGLVTGNGTSTEPVEPVDPTKDPNDKFNYEREPSIRVDKLISKFHQYLDDNFAQHPSFKRKVGDRFATIGGRMVDYYRRKNAECEYWSEANDPDNEDDTTQRYDRTDPCKGAGQLTKSMTKWASIYNSNCRENNRSESFDGKIARQMGVIKEKLRRKFKQCN